MKLLTVTWILVCLMTSQLHAWLILEPTNYSKLTEDADFVGIVEVVGVKDTGKVAEFFADKVLCREVEVQMKILTTVKGGVRENITCVVYRLPTDQELLTDGIKQADLQRVSLNMRVSEVVHHFFVKAEKGDHLLVYLKAGNGAHYLPVSGIELAAQSIFEIKPSNTIR